MLIFMCLINYPKAILLNYSLTRSTYRAIISCLEDNSLIRKRNITSILKPPSDDVVYADMKQHYLFLLKFTEQYRNITPHIYEGYKGPWIENHFLSHFMTKPFEYFNGLVPLFVQWVDIRTNQILNRRLPGIPLYDTLLRQLREVLRRDVIYLVVSQDDEGIYQLQETFPNILIMSCGGYGHIPLPLIKGELTYIPINSSSELTTNVGFYGTSGHHSSRVLILHEVKHYLKALDISSSFGRSADWKNKISRTKFNLSPRGYGRSSFRTAEIIQIGRLPVYLYDDVPWLPYIGTNMSLTNFGYMGRLNFLFRVMREIASTNEAQLMARLEKILLVRRLYTYEGVLEQIELFLQDPLGPLGGYLRCVPLPASKNRL